MITLSVKLVVALIALIGIALARLASRLVKGGGDRIAAEAGSGDQPGSPDRGPGGMRM